MLAKASQLNWDQTFDTVILGFGGAGATAARFAADAGASVLLTDSAPNGHEGGNTRYSAQLIGTVDTAEAGKKYYQRLTYPMALDETMVDTFVDGMAHMRDYVKKYLGVEPVSVKNDFTSVDAPLPLDSAVHEYPEYEGQEAYDFTTVHHGLFDAALWKNLRQQVISRTDKITVWFSSPAKHLIQDPDTKAIIGVQIERDGHLYNIQAKNGVVMAMGGFENDPQAVQDYLGADHLAPLGSLYNKGDGIRMGEEVGADMWHMQNYEALGLLHGMAVAVPEGERGRLLLAWPDIANGSIMTVADDGSRYFDETEPNRHGHIYDHGTWRVPRTNVHPYLVFDQTQYDQIQTNGNVPVPDFEQQLVKADTLTDLATKIGADTEILANTVADFNHFAETGHDYVFNRKPDTMRAFDNGPFYALKMTHDVLNTQGGPRRNAQAEVLDTTGQPIPHLYSAGELGGICANQYQGGGNLAECLIFGKIAGENAAQAKADSQPAAMAASTDTTTGASAHNGLSSDLKPDIDLNQITLSDNQYLGVDNDGIGGEIVVRITYANETLQNIEIVAQSETGEVGGQAVKKLPDKMVAANTYEVDGITGASVSSRAIKNAVKDAIQKAKKAQPSL
ncbi:FAD-binding protein [Secundilactobacillus paracollinoides]|uniref:Urocanate reductase n=1 Tax=Secundilactobacillus paracollinoides TaxID=240427 RepID=A0A1B2J101_9LACO|nr:FAD-binding protein [Secundilactobacillus paracollinoides]ANZ62071.1 fumarate reductase [Secundilactobacillus paracollinoides]ANZ68016.1 fumarate reductase [Secundilactobacillus paracollinoides]